ncbi:MAG: FAD-dependent oxidoreductase [Rhodospirillaceae bacterium]|nr:FAD-dependent oxidoreductase [Rhodospirillaceae bacterium]
MRSPDQDASEPVHHPVVVAGGGMVGLAFAVDMAIKGVPVIVLDDNNQVSVGSRSICVAKRTLEIFDRLGIGDRCVEKGITWNTGKVLRGDKLLYGFDLLPEQGHKRPAFINLQQYYVETYLVERFAELGIGEARWLNKVTQVTPGDDHVALTVETPDGAYQLTCDWLIAADGVKSAVRHALDLPFVGETFHDHFLITDVVMQSDFPTERRFWFDPSFHKGGSALLHKQPDDVWRIDLQLGPQADREEEMKEENILPRLHAMLGVDAKFTIDWGSLYTFQCRRLERFRHDRVFFVGDSAHTVSPFGARGGNGGIQDIDNLAWKLAAVMAGEAGDTLLESYDAERVPAADENILNSTRATDFMAPKNATMALFREAVLDLAEEHAFARAFVNSGRLSVPCHLPDSPLNTPDSTAADGHKPGSPAVGAPVTVDGADGWLLDHLGSTFCLLRFGAPLAGVDLPQLCVGANLDDPEGLLASRYGGMPGLTYLLRPDQHIAACWIDPVPAEIEAGVQRAMGNH